MATTEVELDAIPDGGACEVWLVPDQPGSSVVVLRRGQCVTAFRNICPHVGRFLNWAPGRFLFDHGRLVCAAHGAMFEVDSGHCIDGPCRGSGLVPVPVAGPQHGRVRIG